MPPLARILRGPWPERRGRRAVRPRSAPSTAPTEAFKDPWDIHAGEEAPSDDAKEKEAVAKRMRANWAARRKERSEVARHGWPRRARAAPGRGARQLGRWTGEPRRARVLTGCAAPSLPLRRRLYPGARVVTAALERPRPGAAVPSRAASQAPQPTSRPQRRTLHAPEPTRPRARGGTWRTCRPPPAGRNSPVDELSTRRRQVVGCLINYGEQCILAAIHGPF